MIAQPGGVAVGERQRGDRLGMLADQARESGQARASTARPSCGLEPAAADRASPRPRPGAAAARSGRRGPAGRARGRATAAAAGSSASKRLEQLGAILLAHVGVADRRDMVDQPPPEAGALLRAWSSGSASSSCRQSRSTSGSGVSSSASSAARPPARTRSSGSWPGGQGDEARASARGRHGAGRAAPRAPPPSARPRRRRSRGSGRRTSRHSSSSCASVSAVPSGATDLGDAGLVERDHVHLPFDDDHAAWPSRLAGPARSRLNRVRPLSNSGVSGELRYLGSPCAEDAPAERDHAPARVADREHQPAAEAVIGLLVVLGLDQQAGLDQLVVAELLERAPCSLPAAVGREAEAEALRRVAAPMPALLADSRAPRRPRRRRAARRTRRPPPPSPRRARPPARPAPARAGPAPAPPCPPRRPAP